MNASGRSYSYHRECGMPTDMHPTPHCQAVTCLTCNGFGLVERETYYRLDSPPMVEHETCPICEGDGVLTSEGASA